MSDELRVAVIGCGRMGRIRASAATRYGAHVVALYDANQRVAEEADDHFGTRVVVSSVDDLDWGSLDAIFICTPPSERSMILHMAIERRIPFFVEKPLSLSSNMMSQAKQELARTNLVTAVGYMNRYRHSVQIVRKRLADTRILGMSADWLVGRYNVPWWARKSDSGGPVNEQATHLIDLARYVIGDITEVQALAEPIRDSPELIGTATINLRFNTRQLSSILYSCMANKKMIRMHVYAEDLEFVLAGWDFHLQGDASTVVAYADRNSVFETEVNAFLDAVTTGSAETVLCDFFDALKTQEVVDAIHRSIDDGAVTQVQQT